MKRLIGFVSMIAIILCCGFAGGCREKEPHETLSESDLIAKINDENVQFHYTYWGGKLIAHSPDSLYRIMERIAYTIDEDGHTTVTLEFFCEKPHINNAEIYLLGLRAQGEYSIPYKNAISEINYTKKKIVIEIDMDKVDADIELFVLCVPVGWRDLDTGDVYVAMKK